MVEDLALTQTMHNFTHIQYILPHTGGATASVLDRMLKSFPATYDATMRIFQTRFWWDSAGPTYFHQVEGLLAYGIPKSRLLFGTVSASFGLLVSHRQRRSRLSKTACC